MKEIILKLTMVMTLLLGFSTSFADNKQESSSAPVRVLTYHQVLAGHSYTGQAVVTVRYENGTSYVEHYRDIWIDYGIHTKSFGQGDTKRLSYESNCKDLENDEIFKEFVAQKYRAGVSIIVEIAVTQW